MNDQEDRVDARAELLRAAAIEAGMWISADDRIGESDLAGLIGMRAETLAARRAEGTGPVWFRLGGAGHRVTISLLDAAAWLESFRCNPPMNLDEPR
jgi:hypothetical protein